jgi:hypothetical protein
MSFDCPREELQHRLEWKQLTKNNSASPLAATDIDPQQIDPQVNQDKGKRHKQQPQHRILARRPNPTMVLDSVTALNAKALSILLKELMQCHFNPVNNIEKILHPMPTMPTFVIPTNHPHLATHRPMQLTVEAVVSGIALAASE